MRTDDPSERTPGKGAHSRWIVQGKAVTSGALAKHIEGDSEVLQLSRIAPDVVVLAMSEDRARRLGSELPGLLIDPDADLIR